MEMDEINFPAHISKSGNLQYDAAVGQESRKVGLRLGFSPIKLQSRSRILEVHSRPLAQRGEFQ